MATKTITIPINEYERLQSIARRFEQVNAVFLGDDILVFQEPSTKNAQGILGALKKEKNTLQSS